MTPEMRRAMARYEEARFLYRKAVLASLNGSSSGQAIRQAIREFQRAKAELDRLEGARRGPDLAPRKETRAQVSSLRPRPWRFASNG